MKKCIICLLLVLAIIVVGYVYFENDGDDKLVSNGTFVMGGNKSCGKCSIFKG